MPTIQPTRVSTPTVDGYITVCKGFNLFAQGQAIDLAAEWNYTLADEEPVVALFKVHIKVGFGVYSGVCGPAYAADITLAGETWTNLEGENHIRLDASQSEILAGFELGIGLRLILTFDVWRMVVDAHWVSDGWNSHLEVDEYWTSVGRFGFDLTIDLLMIIARYLISGGENPLVSPERFPSGAGLAMIDSDLSGLATAGHASVEPKFMMMINVLDKMVPGKALIDALQKVGATMMAGPTITLSAPTTVDLKKVETWGLEYDVTTANSVMTGISSGYSDSDPYALKLTLQHSSSIALSIGLGYTCTIAKIFSTSKYTPTIDLLGLLGITPHFGPFGNTISAQYGAAAPPARASRPTAGCCYRVVLHEPEAPAAM